MSRFPNVQQPLVISSTNPDIWRHCSRKQPPGAKKSGTPFMHTTEAAAAYKRVFFSALILSNERRLRVWSAGAETSTLTRRGLQAHLESSL